MNGYDRIVSRMDAAGDSVAEVVLADPEAEAAIWQMHQDQPDWGPRTVADELARRGVYRLDPLERFYPGHTVPDRWTLVDCHVTGVPTVVEAQEVAAVMAADAGLPGGVFPVIQVGESGDPTWVDHGEVA